MRQSAVVVVVVVVVVAVVVDGHGDFLVWRQSAASRHLEG